MPMPALNIIAIHETVRNSGASSSRPSGMRPYLLAASHSTNTTKAEANVTNSQPRFSSIQLSAEPLAEPRPLGLRKPQATNARATTAETANTPRSSEPFSSATRGGGSAIAGCSSVRGSDTESANAGAAIGSLDSRPDGAVGVMVTVVLRPRGRLRSSCGEDAVLIRGCRLRTSRAVERLLDRAQWAKGLIGVVCRTET